VSHRDLSTVLFERTLSRTQAGVGVRSGCTPELIGNYAQLLKDQEVTWEENIRFRQILGHGGQGIVYLSERVGTDGFVLPIAIKVFSPERFAGDMLYEEEMNNMAAVTAKVARIQHDHLLAVNNWRAKNRVRFMEMELIDGFDLNKLLQQEMLDHLHSQVSARRWKHINEVVVTRGMMHPRLMPGIAVPIIRDCLGALAALHRGGVVHGDIKPSNIMLKRTGNAKVIDIGSAFEIDKLRIHRTFTLAYAPPEILEGKDGTPRSDIASLGYVLIEMLSGRRLFNSQSEFQGLQGRLILASKLHQILPSQVASSERLMSFCKGLIAPDPNKRFESAEAADVFHDGAAEFQRELIIGGLACEYEPEIRNWLDELGNYSKNNENTKKC
jgi:serine/threonine-protein kinase